MTDELGLNRKLVRAIYPAVDWDEYDREVVLESEAVKVLEWIEANYSSSLNDECLLEDAWEQSRDALARLRANQ